MLITACSIQTDRAEYSVNSLFNRVQQCFSIVGDSESELKYSTVSMSFTGASLQNSTELKINK